MQAVIEAVMTMEKDPAFDAGRGAFLNAEGGVELDAIVMDGSDLSVGAVGAVRNILHPVALADLVRTRSPACFLVGEGAKAFARRCGVKLVRTEALLVGRERARYLRLRKKKRVDVRPFFEGRASAPARGTVGAVAIDARGGMAAATSTGGIPAKLPGRVGDSPVAGAGAYADSASGGASCTGLGESILRVLTAKTAVDAMARGLGAARAARAAVAELEEKVDGLGGLVVIDASGRWGYAYNTPCMARAVADAEGVREAGV